MYKEMQTFQVARVPSGRSTHMARMVYIFNNEIIRSDPHEPEVTVWFRLLPHVGKVVGHLDEPHPFGGIGRVQFPRRLLALTTLFGRTRHDPL